MTILQLKGNYCVCKGHEKRITKVLSKNKGLFIKNLDLENGFIHIDGDIDIEKVIKELQKKFKSMQVEVVEKTDSDEETDSDKCESVPQSFLTLQNGIGYSAPRLEWADAGGQSRFALRPYVGLNQLRYGGYETTSTYGYDEETDSDKCESGSQPISTLENGVGHSAPRLEWSDMGGLSRSGLRPHGGLTQLGYGGFGTTSTYSYDGQNYQISNYYNQNNDLTKIIRDQNPNACSTM
ncbi:hypothetical protein MANES_07G095602v8 [Manihot esculenta]|uniref:Uncharacterized protein n=1 Tax=Manihot esculenta TaxID=3983 RepID=A0ACB7HF43_MANES|nr:hypothetical protein MANES_07G095602v8 [Manihot esculenta]